MSRVYRVTFRLSQEERQKGIRLLRRENRERKAMYGRMGVEGYKPMTLPEWLMLNGKNAIRKQEERR